MKKRILLLGLIFTLCFQFVQAQHWAELTKTLPEKKYSNLSDNFGESIDVDGNYAVVGAAEYPGSLNYGQVNVLYYNGTKWEIIARLTASDSGRGDNFGLTVSIDGDYIAVGAPDIDGAEYDIGAVYVFKKPAGGWTDTTETAKLTTLKADDFHELGSSVCIDGDYIVAGAVGDTAVADYSGAAYIFRKPASGWTDTTETAKLKASDAEALDYFGISVSMDGNYVLVGANEEDENGAESGAAYIFEKPAAGWTDTTETAKLTAADAAAGDGFGEAVSISGDVCVIGAKNKGTSGIDTGAAYVFVKPVGGWTDTTETAKLSPAVCDDDMYFGRSVFISGDKILVGASHTDDLGSAHLFEKPASGWVDTTETALLTASDGAQYDFFGFAVAFSGDNLLISAPYNDDKGEASGSLYSFEKPTSGWKDTTENQIILPVPYVNNYKESYGASVAIDGDYAVVGAVRHSSDTGRAYVLHRNGNEWERVAVLTLPVVTRENYFGCSVDISGDYVVVGAKYDTNDFGIKTGMAYVFKKPADGWQDSTGFAILSASDGVENLYFGSAVSITDNYIVVGAPGYNYKGLGPETGAVYVFDIPSMMPFTLSERAVLIPSDGADNDYFGLDVSAYGDHVVAGAYGHNSRGGAGYIFKEPASGWEDMTESAKITASDAQADDYLGKSVDISGELIIMGADGDDDNGSKSGSAYLFEKPGADWLSSTETAKFTASDGSSSDFFGRAVAVSGDVAVAGAFWGPNDGTGYIYEKPASGWTDTTESESVSGTNSEEMGNAIDISGGNLIVGDSDNFAYGFQTGAAYIFTMVVPINIVSQPADQLNISESSNANFSVTGNGIISSQWQVSTDGGTTFTDITDDSHYSGTQTTTLNIMADMSLNNNYYRCIVSNPQYADTTDSAMLTVDNSGGSDIDHSLSADNNVYPNPTTGIVYLDFDNISEVTVYDITGRRILNKTNAKGIEKIDLSSYSKGQYMIRILTNQKTFVKKIIKQ